jgi:TNF receptor-associated factor 4
MASSSTNSKSNKLSHPSNDSPLKENECAGCHYRNASDEAMSQHLSECPYVTVPCPNEGCKESVMRLSLMEHNTSCSKAVVSCRYVFFGCKMTFKQEEGNNHCSHYTNMHLDLVMAAFKKLKEQPPQKLITENELAKVTVKLSNYKVLKDTNKYWLSPTFYTSFGGYKLVMVIFPNGYGEDEGDCISCFVCLLPGEFDDILEWPLRGEITVELLNQLEDVNHTKITLSIDEENEFYRVDPQEEINNIEEDLPGVGHSNFSCHSDLELNTTLNVQYLKDDTLYFRVTVSRLDTGPKPWLVTTTN